ncbi:SMI1/KNR4 family protein [Angustibacter luteus]
MTNNEFVARLQVALSRLDEIVLTAVPNAALPPGASEDEVRQRGEDLGLTFTDEIVAYYGWHNGWGSWSLDLEFRSGGFEEDLANTQFRRREAADLAADFGVTADFLFGRTWHTPTTNRTRGPVLDCSGPAAAPTPVLNLELELMIDRYSERVFGSLAEYMEGLVELFEAGAFAFNSSGRARETRVIVQRLFAKGVYN